MVVLSYGLDRHVAGVHRLLLRRHRELWLGVASTSILAGERQQIIGRAADVMVGVWVVLRTLLRCLGLLEVVLAIHSSGCSLGLGGRCARSVVLVVVSLCSGTQRSGLEVACAWGDAGALEVEDGLCVRTGRREHRPASARRKSSS